jgi:opacity protein-like surface antigen
MKQTKILATLALLLPLAFLPSTSNAQATSTASQPLQLSAFVAGTGTFTDLEGGKNGSFTAGVDLTFLNVPHVRPSLEIRGSYPIDQGHISSQKNFLIGPKVERQFGNFHPYADFLIGRGGIDYLNGGFIYGNTLFISSTSTVYSAGGGLDYDLTHHWALKADYQYQHWDAPVVPSGVIHPSVVTFGALYRFDFNEHHHGH